MNIINLNVIYLDESKLEKLRMQLNQDEAERISLKGKIDEINKVLNYFPVYYQVIS